MEKPLRVLFLCTDPVWPALEEDREARAGAVLVKALRFVNVFIEIS